MKRFRSMGFTLIVIGCAIWFAISYFHKQNWVDYYKEELDRFFGEGNWEYIDKKTMKSGAYYDYSHYRSPGNMPPQKHPGKFTNWYITYTNKSGEKEEWYISNHLYKINQDRNFIFSSKRLSSKQAFYIELMDIALYEASKEIYNEFFKSELTENEAASLNITLSESSKLNKEFLNSLMKEPWFTIDNITAEDFIYNDLQDFKIYIRGHDYKVDKLTNEERQNVLEALPRIENRLLEKYGEHASFEIIFDGEILAVYKNGQEHKYE